MTATDVPSLLTFDIEGFAESSQDIIAVSSERMTSAEEDRLIRVNTGEILRILDRFNQRATFFTLGRVARDLPDLVRAIADAGHEVACHSMDHRRLFLFERDQAQAHIAEAKRWLEEAAGQPVVGFRAPDFSITERNPWAWDVLADLGFEYDSSVYPTSLHDVYGISGFPERPFRMANGLIELPMSSAHVLGRQIPFGGGGYLRLYPRQLTEYWFRQAQAAEKPCIVYLHPYEVGPVLPDTTGYSGVRRWRTLVGLGSVQAKLTRLLARHRFMDVRSYLAQHPVMGS